MNILKKNKKVLIAITAFIIFIITLSCSAYKNGAENKLNSLIAQEASNTAEGVRENDNKLTAEIESLSQQRDALNTELAEKSGIQAVMQDYSVKKADYSAQIDQLEKDVKGLDVDIENAQNNLNQKIAAKEEERRLAAEKEAREKELARQQAEAERQANMVWIGDTGTKYHDENCRTLRGNKYQITLEKAKAQGRTACKVCGG